VTTTLVVVASIREGAHERAAQLLGLGPPFDPEATEFDRHEVFLSEREVVFVFEGRAEIGGTLALSAEDPALWRAAEKWSEVLDGRPRVARSAYVWERG
jgi:hypothetical protein